MEKPDADKGCVSSEDASSLTRNRSFKTKQLVRSQAIRESQSPPRTVSPAAVVDVIDTNNDVTPFNDAKLTNNDINVTNNEVIVNYKDVILTNNGGKAAHVGEVRTINVHSDMSSHASDDICSVNSCSEKISDYNDDFKKKQQVEIQITPGAWDIEAQTDQRLRTRRWLGHKQYSSSRDLLSNNPRVACVCGACHASCPNCRGRRRKYFCTTKQDSGIVCSDDCPDCSDSEPSGVSNTEGSRKQASLDADDQTQYCRCPERKEKPKSISLSRTDSDDKSELTGPELVHFIRDTLNKSGRDRAALLKIERELHSLINDTGRCIVRFPVMSSYGRMLVHRCASLFQLSHHLDQSTKTAVLVSKSGTCGGRIPCTPFKQWCTVPFPPSPQRHAPQDMHAKSILKRDTHSLDETGSGALNAARSKSLEQREREYERVRRRIFSSDNCTQDESQWPWLSSGPVRVLAPESSGRNKLLKVQSLESGSGPPQPAWRNRGAVAKSHSFGGYGGGDQPQPRLLSRQGDLASSSWRLSPSSSGYRTLSLHSTDSVTPSPTGGASPEPASTEGVAVVWAVTDMSAVPPGAVVIHPQTGRALTNADGTIYHFDPGNPPPLPEGYMRNTNKVEQTNEKRRGRLEKQHSFIDNDCECQVSEECRNKCCCECRRQQRSSEKISTQQEQTPSQQPTSPCKKRYDETVDVTTNHNPPPDLPTNHRPYEAAPLYEPNQQYSPANERPSFENRQYEPTNQRQEGHFETNQKYEPTNQRAYEPQATNHRPPKLTNQDSLESQYVGQQYSQFRVEEVTSPPQATQAYTQPDLATMQSMAQAKTTPVPMADPNIRSMSLTNMMYPAPMQQGYPYMNQCRMDQQLQPAMYQQMIQAPAEEKPLEPASQESTFRIDPSYPYPPLEYGAACGACADTTGLQHRSYNMAYNPMELPLPAEPQHRHDDDEYAPYSSYNMAYNPMELPPPVVPQYPVGNVLIPPQHLQQYQYQDQMQWPNLQPVVPLGAAPKLYVHELYPYVQYPGMCPQYNVLYPQMYSQTYPVLPTVFPAEQHHETTRRPSTAVSHTQYKRNSASGSSRNTPLQTPPEDKKVPYDEPTNPPPVSRQNSNEIATKIQQIKDQMAQLNTRDNRPRPDWKRRNSGNGILGSYPVNNYNGRIMGRPPNDETQLTSAARAIVNSIRNMQTKNNYHERRPDYTPHYRPEYRPRRPETDRTRYERPDRTDMDRGAPGRGRGVAPAQYRPQYLMRQMSPGTWCRRSPGPIHPVLNHPRRPHPDTRNTRR